MNQTTRRKPRHLLHLLLTWVLIGAQITLPLGALLAAVQPTPQMAQAVAQGAGLGDWIANAAGKATAWAQPLWGQPKTAAAQATNAIWGIKNYTDFGYLNTAVSPWTWVTVATLSGGNYNAAAAITRSQGIIFNQTTRVFSLVNPTTGALTALTLTNAGSIPRTLAYNVATYDPATNRYFVALENGQYGHIFTVNPATNQITYVSEINAGTSINADDWVFVNGKVVGLDYGTVETWDVTNNSYVETTVTSGSQPGEVAGMWLNADGTLGLADQSTGIQQYSFTTNSLTVVAQSSAAFPNGGEPNDLAGAIFGLAPNLPGAPINQPYSGSVAGRGGTAPYSNYTATGLPAGLSINATTGAVTGTPTQLGTYPVTFGVTDSDGYTVSAVYNIMVVAAPGGVAGNLLLWLRADAGIAAPMDGAAIDTWTDQSGNNDASQTGSNRPTFENQAADLWNFNPTVRLSSAASHFFKVDGLAGKLANGNNTSLFAMTLVRTGSNGVLFAANGAVGTGTENLIDYDAYPASGYGVYLNAAYSQNTNVSIADKQLIGTFILDGVQNRVLTNGSVPFNFTGVPATFAPAFTNATRYSIGQEWDGTTPTEFYNGDLPEIIYYNRALSAAEQQRLHTYLAIKYGVTLDTTDANGTIVEGDYVASDGATKVWDKTANTTYHNNVAGIGRDDAEALTQKQSKSINSGFQPTIGLGAIAATNAANANSFSANLSYLVWGDNNQATTYGVAYTPTSFTPAAGYFRMNRVWKVQETGAVGNVTVQGVGADHLLVSNDPTFASGVTEISMSSGSATVDFANGQFFTFGASLKAPGGVAANLAAWYKADGIVGATQWNDESGNGKHMLAAGDGTAARMPTVENTPGAANNFNPRVAFLSNADGNRKWTMTASGNNVFATTTAPGTVFNVSSFPDETIYDVPEMYSFEDDDPGFNLITDRNAANDIRVVFQRDNDGTARAGWDFNVPGVSQIQPLLSNHAWNYAAGGNSLSFNGYSYTPSYNAMIGATSPRYIFGAELTSGGGEAHSGYTSENIVYSVDWPANSSERKRINSYLAIKYGITLLGSGTLAGGAADATFGGTADYLDSASTVIWSGTTSNSGYHNDVAGIGRDDASALNQKQSTSTDLGFQPVIGLGAIAASNAANSNSFGADKSFLLWGSNGQAASYGVSYTPTSFTPAGGYFRMNRVWKVQESGTVGNVVVQGSGADHLLVSSDPTFATGITEIAFSSGQATVNFTNGQFFTFGRALTGPGGVITNLAFWYKPDAGVSLNGGKVSSWVDAFNGIEVTPAVSSNGPTYYASGANLMNFNPTLNFTNATRQDGLRAAAGLPAIPNGVSTFSVLLPDDASNRWFLHWGVSGAGYYNNYGHCNTNNPGVWTNSHGGCVNNPTALGPITTPSFLSSRWNSTAGTNQWQLRRNGQLHSGTTTATALNVPADTVLEIGDVNNRSAGNEYVGNISEVIGYTARVSDADLQKIESYLAIKYGVTYMNDANTAARNYLNSAGATVWDATANSGYATNIAGIGRDDASALLQKQSQSVNSGFQPAIGLGSIAANNAANSNSFSADKNFMVWGDNNQAASYGVSYTPSSFTPAAGYFRMNRVWKVQETGTITNVVVQAAGASHLLVSSDPTFATGVTEIAMSSGQATVNFSNGQFFTFGAEATAPGGVAGNLTAWYKADLGAESSGSAPTDASSIDAWRDQSLSDNDAFQSNSSIRPEWLANNGKFNFNPSVTFVPDARLQAQLSSASWNNSDGSVYVIYNQQTVKTGWRNLVDFGLTAGDSNNPQVGMSDNDRIATWMDGFDRDNTTFQPQINETRLAGYYWQFNVGGHSYTYDGQSYTGAVGHKIGTTGIDIGNFANIGGDPQLGEYFPGQIAEIAIYKEQHNAATQARVQSYFALKYGVTLDANPSNATTNFDYVDSAGTTIWAGNGANSGYHNDVAGIGRDDAAALNQKQAKSVNSDELVTISLGTPAATNSANTNTFAANKSFLIWGNNNGAASFGVSYNPSSFTPAGGYYRMNRVWKVQETGTITNVVVLADGAEHLLVSSDPTFATGVTEIAFSSGSATVNFANGQYFTFGQAQIAPGGVATNLSFWSKADAAGCNAGVNCIAWDDLSANGNPIETIGVMTLQEADAAHNFHPYFSSFSTANYFKEMNSSFATAWPPIDVTEIAVFAVARANSLSADGRITGMDNDDNYAGEPGLSIIDGSPAFYRFSSGPGRVTVSDDVAINTSAIFGARTSGTALTLGLDGKYTASAITAGGGFAGDIFTIGYGTWDINGPFPGDIQEIIWYRTDVSNTERQRIESYLALKYGISLDQSTAQNYLASDGTTLMWNATANAAYSNNIAGIGRDDASALHQKQSRSVNPGFQLAIGLGTVAIGNAANSSTFSANKSFLLWGDNNNDMTLDSSYNGGSNNRLFRVWKVQETGTVGAVKVVLPRSAVPDAGLRSLIVHASDPNFGTVDRTYPLTVSGGNYIATVDFNNGDFFTFSSSLTVPEINVTPGTLDFGETNTGMVSPAQAVTIQNQGDVSLSLSNISLSGTDAARFAISSNGCGATLSAGASCTVQITFAPTTSGSRSALLVITSNDSDESTVNVALSGTTPGSGGGGTPGTYNLAVTKSASVSTATVGVPFTYTITVLNKGTIAASNVTMTDQLPAGVTYNSANATGGGNCTHSSGTVTCTWPSLAGGASATVTISVTP